MGEVGENWRVLIQDKDEPRQEGRNEVASGFGLNASRPLEPAIEGSSYPASYPFQKPKIEMMLALTPAQWVALPALANRLPQNGLVACATGKPKPATSQFPERRRALRATWSPNGGEGEAMANRRTGELARGKRENHRVFPHVITYYHVLSLTEEKQSVPQSGLGTFSALPRLTPPYAAWRTSGDSLKAGHHTRSHSRFFAFFRVFSLFGEGHGHGRGELQRAIPLLGTACRRLPPLNAAWLGKGAKKPGVRVREFTCVYQSRWEREKRQRTGALQDANARHTRFGSGPHWSALVRISPHLRGELFLRPAWRERCEDGGWRMEDGWKDARNAKARGGRFAFARVCSRLLAFLEKRGRVARMEGGGWRMGKKERGLSAKYEPVIKLDYVRPHPGPLPQERVNRRPLSGNLARVVPDFRAKGYFQKVEVPA
jgi:hypothetical protein